MPFNQFPVAAPAVADWFGELSVLAPGSDRTLLRVVAGLLAGGAHIDELRVTSRALTDGALDLVLEGRLRLACELASVTAAVDHRIHELARRPGIWR